MPREWCDVERWGPKLIDFLREEAPYCAAGKPIADMTELAINAFRIAFRLIVRVILIEYQSSGGRKQEHRSEISTLRLLSRRNAPNFDFSLSAVRRRLSEVARMVKSNPYLKTLPTTNPPKKEKKSKVAFAAPTAPPVPAADAEEHERLRAEILKLGGDEEDYRMIQDVDSDSEVEGEPIVPAAATSKKDKTGVDVIIPLHSTRTQLISRMLANFIERSQELLQISRLCRCWRSTPRIRRGR